MIKEMLKFDPLKEACPEVLSTKSISVKNVQAKETKETIEVLHNVLDNLIAEYGSIRGIGLAANQIGVSKRIVVLDINDKRYVLINPIIVKYSNKKRLFRIGCFSLYKYRGLIHYPEVITVEFTDVNGKKCHLSLEGDHALIVQHEIDHLNGKLVYDRLPEGKNDLFIPRETLFPDKRIRIKNYGFILMLKKRLGIPYRQQTTLQYYSALFRESVDWKEYVEKHVKKRSELMELLGKILPKNAKILEAGCGSSALSVYLSTIGHDLTCVDIDPDMLDMAKRCNQLYGGKAVYSSQDLFNLKYKDNSFDLVYSHGVLEELGSENRIIDAINESLRVSDIFVFSVPTLWDRSNNLLGEEILRTVGKWERIIGESNGMLVNKIGCFPFHPRLKLINHKLNNSLYRIAPVILFEITRPAK